MRDREAKKIKKRIERNAVITEKIEKTIAEMETKKGRKMTPEGKQKVRRKLRNQIETKLQNIKRWFRRGIVVALAALGVGAGALALNSGEESKQPVAQEETVQDPKSEFKERLKVLQEENDKKEENAVLKDVEKEWNEQYPEYQISEEDLSVITSNPKFLTKITNDDESIDYVQDYNASDKPIKGKKEYLYERDYFLGEGISVVVNKKNREVIYSIGTINGNLSKIKTERVMDRNNITYEKRNDLNIEFESEEQKVNMYEKLIEKEKEITEGRKIQKEIEQLKEWIGTENEENER